MDYDESGWRPTDQFVCGDCLADHVLASVARNGDEEDPCSFCQHMPAVGAGVASLDDIVALTVEGISTEYEVAGHGIPYEHVKNIVEDTRDILYMHNVSDSEEVSDAIAASIENTEWLSEDFYEGPSGEMRLTWEGFRETVKHQRRYTFMLPVPGASPLPGGTPLEETLPAVAKAITDSKMLVQLPQDSYWWRVRVNPPKTYPLNLADLGHPPKHKANDNRMTPKGITAFYGASTDMGAIAEVAGYAERKASGALAQWRTVRPLLVADLRNIPDLPSIFDGTPRYERQLVLFMRNFIQDVQKIAGDDEKQDLENIPTQIVAEYLQQPLRGQKPIQGVLWRSVKDLDVTCCVLFIELATLIMPGTKTTGAVLELVPTSVRVLDPPLKEWL